MYIHVYVYNRLFGVLGRARDYLPMAIVILCGRSQFFIQATGKIFSTEYAIYSKFI